MMKFSFSLMTTLLCRWFVGWVVALCQTLLMHSGSCEAVCTWRRGFSGFLLNLNPDLLMKSLIVLFDGNRENLTVDLGAIKKTVSPMIKRSSVIFIKSVLIPTLCCWKRNQKQQCPPRSENIWQINPRFACNCYCKRPSVMHDKRPFSSILIIQRFQHEDGTFSMSYSSDVVPQSFLFVWFWWRASTLWSLLVFDSLQTTVESARSETIP